MSIGLGFKTYVLFIFFIIFIGSLLIMNTFYTKQQNAFSNAFSTLRSLSTNFETLSEEESSSEINEILDRIGMLQIETRLYSSIMLFFIFILSCFLFIFLIFKLTKPLHELLKATKNIKGGDYNVYISPTGVKEVADLAKSFNEMSKELENTQQRFLLSQKQMIWKDLARILTHEIKNPLTPIQLTTQRMEEIFYSDKNKFEEIFPESLQLVYLEINNLQNLVTSFSSFAKDVTVNQTVFDPAIAVYEIIKPYMKKYDIVLNLQDNQRINFDNTHFYQIVTNIFQNAIESFDLGPNYAYVNYPKESPKIFIDLEKSNSYITLKIRDQGPGIGSDDLPRIFEPYFTKKSKGTGLGLALVKKLCEANHCFVRVKSIVGEGTVFELILEDKA
ncbi:MAG: HAMP domain-containing histidine kinase [Candidatus Cloacimonetes bacterium]|nr:HAMP domain-containing histidine kinase [Candidatus Cloacimonadota bacterium]